MIYSLEFLVGVGVFVMCLIWVALLYNRTTKYVQLIVEQRQNIAVSLKKRYELIPELITVAGSTGQHEKLLQNSTTLLRSLKGEKPSGYLEDQQGFKTVEQQMGKVIIGIKEKYPALKAPDSYKKIQTELINTENELAGSRRLYNSAAALLQEQFGLMPNRFFVTAFGFKPEPFFEFDIATVASIKINSQKDLSQT